jgi:hypothetical protein
VRGVMEPVEIDGPTAVRCPVIYERILDDAHCVESGEEIEQWVGRAWDQDFVAGVGQQFEDERVGFAGAGGEENAAGAHAAGVVILRNRGASGRHSSGGGLIAECAWIGQGSQDPIGWIGESGGGGIRFGEVENGGPGGSSFIQQPRKAIGCEVPAEPRRPAKPRRIEWRGQGHKLTRWSAC